MAKITTNINAILIAILLLSIIFSVIIGIIYFWRTYLFKKHDAIITTIAQTTAQSGQSNQTYIYDYGYWWNDPYWNYWNLFDSKWLFDTYYNTTTTTQPTTTTTTQPITTTTTTQPITTTTTQPTTTTTTTTTLPAS